MKIGLYFGSFNPIHIGHLLIGNYVANYTPVQQVWYIVSPQNPFKKSSILLNEYQRLHLVKIAINDDPQLKVSDIEFALPRPSFTVDTMVFLQEKYPQHTFSIIIGSDSYQNISKWKNSDYLLKNYSFLVYQRPGFPVDVYPHNVALLKAPLLDISSSMVRKAIEDHKTIRYMVPQAVMEEIEKGGYYKK